MAPFAMPAAMALELLTLFKSNGVHVCVGGGWAVDALLGEQTRPHSDLDVWVPATDAEALLSTCAELQIDRIYPWPGDRPWNFVLHDAGTRRVDLHFYEHLGADDLHYGSVTAPFLFAAEDVAAQGSIAGVEVRCESPRFALQCHTGYPPREVDRRDVAALCDRFSMRVPDGYRGKPAAR